MQRLPNTVTVICVQFAYPPMSVELRTPTARVCERCGRGERWDETLEAWQLAAEDGEKQIGNPHCLHEWDINGAFNPIRGN